jgi:hypothetical protein
MVARVWWLPELGKIGGFRVEVRDLRVRGAMVIGVEEDRRSYSGGGLGQVQSLEPQVHPFYFLTILQLGWVVMKLPIPPFALWLYIWF